MRLPANIPQKSTSQNSSPNPLLEHGLWHKKIPDELADSPKRGPKCLMMIVISRNVSEIPEGENSCETFSTTISW